MAEDQASASPQAAPITSWPTWQKQIALLVLVLLIPVILVFLGPILKPLLLVLLLAVVLAYPIRFLHRRLSLSYRLSVAIVFLVFLLLVLALVVFLATTFASVSAELFQGVQGLIDRLLPEPYDPSEGLLDLSALVEPLNSLAQISAGRLVFGSIPKLIGGVAQVLGRAANVLGTIAFVVFVLVFMLFEAPSTLGAIGRRLPEAPRREVAILIQRSVTLYWSYLFGSLVIAGVYWLVATALFAVTGVRNSIALGLIVALPYVVPYVGRYGAIFAVFLVTLITGSQTTTLDPLVFALIEAGIFWLISAVGYYLVDLRIYSRAVRVPIWVMLVGVAAFGAALGVFGVIIAAATIAVLGEVLDFVIKKVRGLDPYPGVPEPAVFVPYLASGAASQEEP
jgi:predicted PurR-regulated permease PerM